MLSVKTSSKSMPMPQIRAKAKALGLAPGKMKKADLIRAIQLAEGNQPCFSNAEGWCQHEDCCFLHDCLKTKS